MSITAEIERRAKQFGLRVENTGDRVTITVDMPNPEQYEYIGAIQYSFSQADAIAFMVGYGAAKIQKALNAIPCKSEK